MAGVLRSTTAIRTDRHARLPETTRALRQAFSDPNYPVKSISFHDRSDGHSFDVVLEIEASTFETAENITDTFIHSLIDYLNTQTNLGTSHHPPFTPMSLELTPA